MVFYFTFWSFGLSNQFYGGGKESYMVRIRRCINICSLEPFFGGVQNSWGPVIIVIQFLSIRCLVLIGPGIEVVER